MTRSSAWISVVALFMAGVAIGALAMHLYQERRPHPPPGPFDLGPPQRIVRQVEERLGLTEEQKERIREIREESWRRSEEIRREVRPRLEEHIEQTREKIYEVLTPEQREKFDEWWRENRRPLHRFFLGEGRRGRRGPRHTPPGPPPPEPPPSEPPL